MRTVRLVVPVLLAAGVIAAASAARLPGKIVYFAPGATTTVALEFATGKAVPLGIEADHPALSPDGRTLAYIDGRERLHVRDLATGREVLFAAERTDYASPTFVSNDEVAYLRIGRETRIVVSRVDRVEERVWPGRLVAMEVAPQIAAVPGRDAFVLCAQDRESRGLWLLTKDAPRPILAVTEEGDVFRYPAVSPDGAMLAFSRDVPGGTWTVALDGRGLKQVDKDGSWPAWSPDGKHLAVLTTAAVTRGLAVVDGTGREIRRTGGGSLQAIAIVPAGGGPATALLGADGQPLRTRGDAIAWR